MARGLVPEYIQNRFLNILRRQRDEDIATQNRAIIAAIVAANVGPAPAAAPVPVLAPAPTPVLAANVVHPIHPNHHHANNAQQDSDDPNIGCIGTSEDPNIGCVSTT